VNCETGEVADTESGLNRQTAFGGDVISRIQYALEHENGETALRAAIVEQLNGLATALCARNGILMADIPVCNETMRVPAQVLGLRLHPEAVSVVGGDVTAGVVSSCLAQSADLSLFIE